MGRYVHGTWGFSCVRSPVGNPRGLWVVFLLKSRHGQQEMWSSYSLCLLSSLSFPSCIRVCFTDPGAPGEQQGSPAIPERADRFSLNTSLSTSSAREATTAPWPPQQSRLRSSPSPFRWRQWMCLPGVQLHCTEALVFGHMYPISFQSKERRKWISYATKMLMSFSGFFISMGVIESWKKKIFLLFFSKWELI